MPRCAYITHLMAKTSEGGAEKQMFRTMEAIGRSRSDRQDRSLRSVVGQP